MGRFPNEGAGERLFLRFRESLSVNITQRSIIQGAITPHVFTMHTFAKRYRYGLNLKGTCQLDLINMGNCSKLIFQVSFDDYIEPLWMFRKFNFHYIMDFLMISIKKLLDSINLLILIIILNIISSIESFPMHVSFIWITILKLIWF